MIETDNMIKIDKKALDTLVYFSFGFTVDDEKEIILRNIVKKAFNDATNQGAFNTKVKENLSSEVKDAKEKGINFVYEKLNEYTSAANREAFKQWHNSVCKELKNCFSKLNDIDWFSYGNAQKVINMSLKYIFLLGLIPEYRNRGGSCSVSEIVNNVFSDGMFLDVPIDSYIIDELGKEENTKATLEKVIISQNTKYQKGKKKGEDKPPHEYVKGWSSWNDDEYMETRDKIFEMIKETPIEWEMENWIKQAKLRRKDS